MTNKRSRPVEWLFGYLLLSLLGAIGPVYLLQRYADTDLVVGSLILLSANLGLWAGAGILYHEPGRSNDRWARRLASSAQWLAMIGLAIGLIVAAALGVAKIRSWL